ncbi:unnamed protein product [Orchesella dallaii]|uniref:Uncharacterized protein n=1 Tax=Orchesella dallaii TaxID=48710 RepID=A0ABP1QRB5_9HEXA
MSSTQSRNENVSNITPPVLPYFDISVRNEYYSHRCLASRCATGSMSQVGECLESFHLNVLEILDLGCGPTDWTCLMYACRFLNEETIFYLLENGSDLNFCSPDGMTPLMAVTVACSPKTQKRSVRCIQQLFDAGMKIAHVPTFNYRSVLTMAVLKGCDKLVKVLLDSGAKPNQRDDLGETAFNIAVKGNQKEIIKLLFNAGANPYIKNLNGVRFVDFWDKDTKLKDLVYGLLHKYAEQFNGNQDLRNEMLEEVNKGCKPSKKKIKKDEKSSVRQTITGNLPILLAGGLTIFAAGCIVKRIQDQRCVP